jgi:hypothetical protein
VHKPHVLNDSQQLFTIHCFIVSGSSWLGRLQQPNGGSTPESFFPKAKKKKKKKNAYALCIFVEPFK